MFEYKTTIKMHDTDAAGILFFANQFKLVHDAFEGLMESGGLGVGKLLANGRFILPIVHAETDFFEPLRVGDRVAIKLSIKNKGTSSFRLSHKIYKGDKLAGSGETVHVSIDRNTGKKIALPGEVLDVLTS
jgi:1,4-dihydroxy-2-naphthoyl-CoA hydrolase